MIGAASRESETPAFEAVAQAPVLPVFVVRGGPEDDVVLDHGRSAVPQNFIDCHREQELLLPPSLREWLPDDHLAWFVLDAVEQMDLAAFYGAYREDGWGRAAFEPKMMVAHSLYAYAIGERSSRRLERRCREDVAFRVITANHIPTTRRSRAFAPGTSRRWPTPFRRYWRSAQGGSWSR